MAITGDCTGVLSLLWPASCQGLPEPVHLSLLLRGGNLAGAAGAGNGSGGLSVIGPRDASGW